MSPETIKGNYEVGFRKPPEGTRFQKGKSGNPAGRPKGTLNIASVIERALLEKVVIKEGRHRRTMTKLEAGAKQLANKVGAGDLRAFSLTTALLRLGEARSEQETNETGAFAEPDQRMHYERIPGSKGKVRSDGRTLVDILNEIYGLREYAPKPPALGSASRGPDRGLIATKG